MLYRLTLSSCLTVGLHIAWRHRVALPELAARCLGKRQFPLA